MLRTGGQGGGRQSLAYKAKNSLLNIIMHGEGERAGQDSSTAAEICNNAFSGVNINMKLTSSKVKTKQEETIKNNTKERRR